MAFGEEREGCWRAGGGRRPVERRALDMVSSAGGGWEYLDDGRGAAPPDDLAADDLRRRTPYRQTALRRAVDLVVGSIGCVMLLFLLPAVALGVWLDVGRPIFFCQERLGLGGRVFRLFKVRTMPSDAESEGPQRASVKDPRVSWFGRILRRSHLDEMPQFWNILRGDMSLIGPRPERPEHDEWLTACVPDHAERCRVKPGLTGWAQINCGYTDSPETAARRHDYDLYYIEHRNLWLDVRIVLRTAWTVLTLKGR